MAGYTEEEEEYEQSQDTTPVSPPKGSADWVAQNSGTNAPELKAADNPAPGTLEAHENTQSDKSTAPGGVVAPGSTSTSQNKTPDATDKDDQEGPRYGNMQDVIDYLERARAAIHIPTKEELEKERRRRRTEGIISSIADGASAISNLITTTQYAPDMYDGNSTMTGKMKERYDRLKAEHEADADRYFNYSLTLAKLKEGQDDKEYQRGSDALQDQIARSKAENAAKLADIKYRRTLQQISDAEAAAEEREANRELDRQIKEARRDLLKSQAKKNDRWVPSSGRRSGGGSKGRHPWRDDKGAFGEPGKIYYETSADGAREMAAMHNGTYLTTESRSESTSTGKDIFGQERKTTTTTVRNTSTPGGKAKQVISQDNTPPSRRNKK